MNHADNYWSLGVMEVERSCVTCSKEEDLLAQYLGENDTAALLSSITEPSPTGRQQPLSLSLVPPSILPSSPCFVSSATRACLQPTTQ